MVPPLVLAAMPHQQYNRATTTTMQGVHLAYQMPHSSPISPRAAAGIALQLFGLCSVIYCDHLLISLRKPGEMGYKIPRGGMFNFTSAGAHMLADSPARS